MQFLFHRACWNIWPLTIHLRTTIYYPKPFHQPASRGGHHRWGAGGGGASPRPPCQGQAHRHCQASPGEDKNSFLPVSDQNSIYMLQGNAGVFEACVNALSEPQKLAIRTVLAWASHTWSTTIISWQYIIIERKEYILCRVYARNKYKFFIKMACLSNICDWTNILHVVVMESIWKLNTNEIRWLYCCAKQSRDK